ncbi:polyisoprenoid-binding protein [Flaviflexus salsibiostraticola]|uniref:Polyisoprenoid-binding protein n=1 Tax=Flaviflexus salsibiostraticola TaxID=1282737 RepID=A0A3S8ZBD6_9ACTO|nr:YceI family protein [Flaviflexus salsibiostraticola]AZN30809.1 polyisoprenoid-binding protein [Flaviflexus salsibiostraticola]
MTTLNTLSGTYTLDPSHTQLGFVARHAMVTKVRGRFSDFEGTATTGENLENAKITVTIKADSIDTRNEDRDNHVRGGDFFDVENHPEITFESTDIAASGDSLVVTGDLTIKGTTKPVTIDFDYMGVAEDPFGNERVGLEGSVVVNRKDWNIDFDVPLKTGGLLVSEKITLEFEISAIKAA